MLLGAPVEPRHQRIEIGVGPHLGGIEEQLLAPDEPRLLAELDDLLEEALEDREAEPLPNAGQAGVVRERLIEPVTEVPAVGEMQTRGRDQLPLGAEALEEHDELQLEEDHRVDRGPTPSRIAVLHPLADEPEIKLGIEVPVEVVRGDQAFERDRNGLVERATLRRTKHERHPKRGAEEHGKPRERWWCACGSGPESTLQFTRTPRRRGLFSTRWMVS